VACLVASQDEWRSLIYIDHAVIDRDAAWTQVREMQCSVVKCRAAAHFPTATTHSLTVLRAMHRIVVQVKGTTGFGPGGSKSNSLFWVASRPPPTVGVNVTAKAADPKASVKAACTANSACDAMGLVGNCCPTDTTSLYPGTSLGCCPTVVSHAAPASGPAPAAAGR